MSLLESISPTSITGAALVAQFSIVAIMFVGSMILRSGEEFQPFYRTMPGSDSSMFAWIILAFFLVTTGSLVFSDEFSDVWMPLFGRAPLPTVPWSYALLFTFLMNILCVTIIVWGSGGAWASPFSPLFFLLPTLALFLREPLGRVLIYLGAVGITFSLTLYSAPNTTIPSTIAQRVTYWLVSISCLLLATFIGYITRPA